MVLGLRTIARGLVGGACIAAGAAVLVGVAAVTTVATVGAVAKGLLKGAEVVEGCWRMRNRRRLRWWSRLKFLQ